MYPLLDDVAKKKGKGWRASVRHLSISLIGEGKHEWDGVEGKRVEWGR